MRYLIFRLGAFGDVVITTPIIRHLHAQGHEIVYVANERGVKVLENNPRIKLLIEQKTDSIANHLLADHIQWLKKKHKCDEVIDFSESIEVSLSQHPRGPNYKLPKYERYARYNINFYEYAFKHAGLTPSDSETYIPELYFTESEISKCRSYLKDGHNILLGLSGSGNNKTWPYSQDLCNELVSRHPNIHIITVGDYKCKLLEPEKSPQVTPLSGEISMRESMCLTSLVDLVISPDTGLLHASGCYKTPKIGLLGHNTRECITKHFMNDYSIEADSKKAECSPCFFLVYDMKLQCPLNPITQGSVCMSDGITLDMVLTKFEELYAKSEKGSR